MLKFCLIIILRMKQQSDRQNSDETDKQQNSAVQFGTQRIQSSKSLQTTLGALFYKSVKLQSRNYCANICQIISPILCLLFTLAVRQIVGGITTGAVKSFQYPRPFNLPMMNMLIRPQIGLDCQQIYYFETSQANQKWTNKLISMQLKQMCPSNSLNPKFIKKEQINSQIMNVIKTADLQAFQRGEDLKTQIPDGFIRFKEINKDSLSATFEYHKNNGVTKIMIKTSVTSTISTYLQVTEGMMSLIDKITAPFLQLSDPNQILVGSYMYMPFSGEDQSFINKMVNILGSGLYPLGLSLLLPLLLYTIVSEKQQKQLQIMKMNGLDVKYYWVNFFIVSFILSMITSLVMYIFGNFVIQITFFTKTAASIIWVMFIAWAIAQISMTSFVQIFINSSKTATIIGYILSIFSTLIGVTLCTVVFPYPMKMPFYLLCYPPFALSRIVFHIGLACSDSRECYRSFQGVDPEVNLCLALLFGSIVIYIASIWLSQMVQQQFGVAHRPKIIEHLIKRFSSKQKKNQLIEQNQYTGLENNTNSIQMANVQLSGIINQQNNIDQSVQKHKKQVEKSSIYGQPLIIKQISKTYQQFSGQKQTIALKPLSIKLIKGEIFGFLGPNGAGKTTLISVLTGMYPQTSGNAWISGLQIGHPKTNKLIGVCPQFDILWGDLTVQEHLIFYCKLKQVHPSYIEDRVKQSLQDVDLFQSKHLQSKQLSGGMQRRLSIAIALVGSPSVLFLDEPSSGLDPVHRRQIWNILLKCKRKTTIFMTSHLMDQVQFLCDRIGIISQGQLMCIGEINRLKEKYGSGYRLTISYHTSLRSDAPNLKRPKIVSQLIKKYQLQIVNELQTRIVFKIFKEDIQTCTQWLQNDNSLVWSISPPSLYDLFMHFVK